MVQVKKDEVKKAIEDAAINIFYEMGYLSTKMIHIAKRSNISVGNIYRYFKNKDELFYTILPQSFADFLKKYNLNLFIILNEAAFDNSKNIEDCLPRDERIEYLIENRKQLLILFRHSKGTKYENFKDELTTIIIEAQKMHLQKLNLSSTYGTEENDKFIRIIIDNITNMLLDSFKGEMSIDERKNIIRFVYIYNIYGLKRLLEEYS